MSKVITTTVGSSRSGNLEFQCGRQNHHIP
jgi:hypothetical protein